MSFINVFAKMNLLTIRKSKATVVVGVDFGTTFSGFAFALTSEPKDVHRFYDWPDLGPAGGAHYCKTPTSLLYDAGQSPGSYRLLDWGYSALVQHARSMKSKQPEQISFGENLLGSAKEFPVVPVNGSAWRARKHYLTLFKFHLIDGEAGQTPAAELPEGLTPRRVISDYLRKLSEFIMSVLHEQMGTHITMEDVQWCLTIPAIWHEKTKQEMKICASIAGMIKGHECPPDSMDTASPHPVIIVIEPEAASLYCQRKVQFPLHSGDQFLIVDVGGGSVDLVLHEKISSGVKVREVSPSSGGLFGGSFVDKAFFDFLGSKISCFQEFSMKHTDSVLKLKGWWETIKYGFDGTAKLSYDLELPARLARAWEEDESSKRSSCVNDSYDVIELSLDVMLGLFNPVVNGILNLIESKMTEGVNVRAMMVVGGFSGSPYLIKRIKEVFSERVGTIVVPDEPGAAICCGAVSYGIYGADVIMSRRSKKTYGIRVSLPFCLTDPRSMMSQDEDGESYCHDVFLVFTKKNDEVPLEHVVTHRLYPFTKNQTEISIALFSSFDSKPRYVCDPGVTKEGTFHVTCPSEIELGERPEVLISMFFGKTMIEMHAEGQNFRNGEKSKMTPVRFEKSLE